jgi:replicative DNA helicase
MIELDYKVQNPQFECELMLLGALLQWPDLLDDFVVDVEWFDDAVNRQVFVKVRQVFGDGDVSPVSVALGEQPNVVSRVYDAFSACFASRVSFEYYLGKLREGWAKRIIRLGLENLLGDDADSKALIQKANRVLQMAELSESEDVVSSPVSYHERYLEQMSEGVAFMPSAWGRLNKLIGGWRDSGFYLVGGRPGQGKTTVLLQAAWDLARQGKKVLFVSLEMPVLQLQHRILSQTLSIDVTKIADNDLDYEIMHADKTSSWASDMVRDAQGLLNDNLLMISPESVSPMSLRALIRRQQRVSGLDAVFVDYLQISDDDEKHSIRSDQVRSISGKYKKIARKFDLPLITAVQLNREVESRVKGSPRLTDISESDKPGMDADVAIMIHREFQEGDNPDGQGSDLYLKIVKNRHGETGSARFVAQDGFARIVEKL